MAKHRTVILGGGWGGIATAVELRRRLGSEHDVVVVDRRDHFRLGFRKIWTVVGRAAPGEGSRPLSALSDRGIQVVQAEIRSIDPARRTVETDAGRLQGDALVIALGAEPRPDRVPGFAREPHAYNLYDPEAGAAARERLEALAGGRVLVAVLGLPYKCPPAPYEAALLVGEHLRQRGARDAFDLAVSTPQPSSLPMAGEAACAMIEGTLEAHDVTLLVRRPVAGVEGSELVFQDGGRRRFDLLLGVPPHTCPQVVRDAGLTGEHGWVTVRQDTLRTPFEGVYAVGDATHVVMANDRPMPKAGVFAEGGAQVVAGGIAAEVESAPPPPAFDGRGACFLELGNGVASLVRGEFLAESGPRVEVVPPSPAHLEEKLEFERERLRGWF